MNSCTEMSPPFPYPQGMLLKLARRAPILAWRMGLGRVLGHVLALITTTDCESGRPHRVVTRYFTYRGKLIVPCALGERSDWYRNVMANPRATVQTWQGAEAMRAEVITEAEEIRALYPVAMRCNPGTLSAYLRSLGIDPDDVEDVVAKRARLACFRFEPTEELTPPPLMADLLWVWPVMLGLALMGAWLRQRHPRAAPV